MGKLNEGSTFESLKSKLVATLAGLFEPFHTEDIIASAVLIHGHLVVNKRGQLPDAHTFVGSQEIPLEELVGGSVPFVAGEEVSSLEEVEIAADQILL